MCTEALCSPHRRANMLKDFLVLHSSQAPRHSVSFQVLLISFCPLLNMSFEIFPPFYYETSSFHRKCSTSQILCILERSIECIYSQIHVLQQGSPIEVQTPTCQNLIGDSIIPPLVSCSSIHLPLSPHCTLVPARKNLVHI